MCARACSCRGQHAHHAACRPSPAHLRAWPVMIHRCLCGPRERILSTLARLGGDWFVLNLNLQYVCIELVCIQPNLPRFRADAFIFKLNLQYGYWNTAMHKRGGLTQFQFFQSTGYGQQHPVFASFPQGKQEFDIPKEFQRLLQSLTRSLASEERLQCFCRHANRSALIAVMLGGDGAETARRESRRLAAKPSRSANSRFEIGPARGLSPQRLSDPRGKSPARTRSLSPLRPSSSTRCNSQQPHHQRRAQSNSSNFPEETPESGVTVTRSRHASVNDRRAQATIAVRTIVEKIQDLSYIQ